MSVKPEEGQRADGTSDGRKRGDGELNVDRLEVIGDHGQATANE